MDLYTGIVQTKNLRRPEQVYGFMHNLDLRFENDVFSMLPAGPDIEVEVHCKIKTEEDVRKQIEKKKVDPDYYILGCSFENVTFSSGSASMSKIGEFFKVFGSHLVQIHFENASVPTGIFRTYLRSTVTATRNLTKLSLKGMNKLQMLCSFPPEKSYKSNGIPTIFPVKNLQILHLLKSSQDVTLNDVAGCCPNLIELRCDVNVLRNQKYPKVPMVGKNVKSSKVKVLFPFLKTFMISSTSKHSIDEMHIKMLQAVVSSTVEVLHLNGVSARGVIGNLIMPCVPSLQELLVMGRSTEISARDNGPPPLKFPRVVEKQLKPLIDLPSSQIFTKLETVITNEKLTTHLCKFLSLKTFILGTELAFPLTPSFTQNLTVIYLDICKDRTLMDLYRSTPQLIDLSFGNGTQITDDGILGNSFRGGLYSLKELQRFWGSLSSKVTDRSVDGFLRCRKLKYASVAQSAMTFEGIRKLLSNMTTLRDLDVRGCNKVQFAPSTSEVEVYFDEEYFSFLTTMDYGREIPKV